MTLDLESKMEDEREYTTSEGFVATASETVKTLAKDWTRTIFHPMGCNLLAIEAKARIPARAASFVIDSLRVGTYAAATFYAASRIYEYFQ